MADEEMYVLSREVAFLVFSTVVKGWKALGLEIMEMVSFGLCGKNE